MLSRPIRPSETQESGFVPEEISEFRAMYHSLRRQYGDHQLFGVQEDYQDQTNDNRDGRLFPALLNPIGFLNSLFSVPMAPVKQDDIALGASLDVSQLIPNVQPGLQVPVPLANKVNEITRKLPGIEPCSNYEGVCQNFETCIKTGGTPVGQCHRCLDCDVCCKYVYESQAMCEAPIAFFQSPDFPEMRDSPHSASLTFTVRSDVEQVLIEFIDFEMGVGSDGCTDFDYLEVIVPSKSEDLIGPGNAKFCGINTGQHLYLDVSAGDLLILKVVATGESFPHKQDPHGHQVYHGKSKPYRFKIKVTQILSKEPFRKTYLNLGMLNFYKTEQVGIPKYYTHLRAPASCTQYYQGRKGTVENFNFDGRSKFPNNLDYSVCIRAPRDACRFTLAAFKFNIPASDRDCVNGSLAVANGHVCCTKGHSSGDEDNQVEKYLGFDGNSDGLVKNNQFRYFYCGERMGHTDFAVSERKGPIVLKVFSCDKTVEGQTTNVGFKVGYNVEVGTC